MAIVNSLRRIISGFGAGAGPGAGPGGYATAAAVALSGATAQTTPVTMGGQGYTNGMIRVKVYNGGGANTTVALTISATDGTNTYIIATVPATAVANAANSGLDMLFEVNVDILIATVNLISTLAGTTTTATMDYEVDLNP